MRDVLADLRRAAEGRKPAGPHGQPFVRRRTRWRIVAGIVLVALLLLGGFSWRLWFQIPKQSSEDLPRFAPVGNLLFEDRFARSGPSLGPAWQTIEGTWEIQDNACQATMEEPYHPAFAFVGDGAWRDYVITCDLRLAQARAGLAFRCTADGRGYVFVIGHGEVDPAPERGYSDPPAFEFRKFALGKARQTGKIENGLGQIIAAKELPATEDLSRAMFHNVRVEVVGNTMRAFVNGVFVLEAKDEHDAILSGQAGFFAADSVFRPSKAWFKRLRVWEFSTTRPVNAAVAVWDFQRGPAARAEDYSGKGNHGEFHGGIAWVDGRDGKAIRLNGVDAFVTVPDAPTQSGMSELSIHTLFKMHTSPTSGVDLLRKWGTLGDERGPEDDSYCLRLESDRRLMFSVQNGVHFMHAGSVYSSDPIPLGQWVEVLAVYNGAHVVLHQKIGSGKWSTYQGLDIPDRVRGYAVRDIDEPIEIGVDPLHKTFLNATIQWIRITAAPEKRPDQ